MPTIVGLRARMGCGACTTGVIGSEFAQIYAADLAKNSCAKLASGEDM